MKDYLDERISELRERYKDTGDSRWRHRYNEAMLIRERLVLRQIDSEQDAGRSERRTVLSPEHPGSSTDSNG
jgi:hypothetical protein